MMPTPQRMPTLRQYTELAKFNNKLNILSFTIYKYIVETYISVKLLCNDCIVKKRYTNNLELNLSTE